MVLGRGAAFGRNYFIAARAQWMANFTISMTFAILLSSVGLAGADGFYTRSAFISMFFMVKYHQQSRGKSLQQM